MKKWYEVGLSYGHGYGVMAETPEEALDQVWHAVFEHAVDVTGGASKPRMFEKKDLVVKEISDDKLYHIIPAE